MKKINVLSLFDGISCARVAIERAGFKTSTYYASEIDSYATQVSEKNYPDIIRLGDIKNLNWNATNRYETIDLLIGGSPCQDLSIANTTRKGLDGARSGLFWEYVRVLKEAKPKYFILENVASMPKEARRIIAETLGVEPIMIDAALVSAQTRKRLFWTNIPGITQPKDRGLIVKDIIEKKVDEKYFISEKTLRNIKKWNNAQSSRIRTMWGKSVTLQAGGGGVRSEDRTLSHSAGSNKKRLCDSERRTEYRPFFFELKNKTRQSGRQSKKPYDVSEHRSIYKGSRTKAHSGRMREAPIFARQIYRGNQRQPTIQMSR